MKIEVKRIVKNRHTGEERAFIDEIDTKDVQCLYKDKFGVYLSLTSGYLIKVEDVTLSELQNQLGY
jgi:hypothetical protein